MDETIAIVRGLLTGLINGGVIDEAQLSEIASRIEMEAPNTGAAFISAAISASNQGDHRG